MTRQAGSGWPIKGVAPSGVTTMAGRVRSGKSSRAGCATPATGSVRRPVQGFPPWRRARRSSRSAAARSRSRNPDKVYFPVPGYTKLDVVRYFLAVADGALAGVRRPADGAQAVRRRDRQGAVLPEAGTRQPARVDAGRDADVPLGPDGGRDRGRRGGGPRVGGEPRLHRPQPAPGARRRPRSPRRAARRPRPRARRALVAGPRGGPRRARDPRRGRASSAGPRRPARAGSTSTCGSSARWTYGEVRRAALALARDVERRAPSIATSKWWKEERHGVFLDYNQNAKDRTVASAYSVRPLPDARVSFPLRWDEVADVAAEDFTLATVPALFAERGDAGAGIDEAVGSLEALLELSRAGRGRGPGRRAVAAELREAGGRAAAGPAVEEAQARRGVRGPRQGRRPAARGRRRARGGRRGGRPERGPADRVGGHAPDAHRPPQVVHPGHRDRAGRDEGRGQRGPRALEGAPPRGRRAPRARRHPHRRDARPRLRLVPAPGQPDPRARGQAARPRSRSTPTTTPGRATNGPTRAASRSGRRRRSRPRTARRATEPASGLPCRCCFVDVLLEGRASCPGLGDPDHRHQRIPLPRRRPARERVRGRAPRPGRTSARSGR